MLYGIKLHSNHSVETMLVRYEIQLMSAIHTGRLKGANKEHVSPFNDKRKA